MKRDYRDYIDDMREALAEIESFTKGMDREVFVKDKKTINAVVRSLEVLGEAARNIPNPVKQRYQAIPWKSIMGMRNKLIHEYFGIDVVMVWETVRSDLPSLMALVEKMRDGESGQPGMAR